MVPAHVLVSLDLGVVGFVVQGHRRGHVVGIGSMGEGTVRGWPVGLRKVAVVVTTKGREVIVAIVLVRVVVVAAMAAVISLAVTVVTPKVPHGRDGVPVVVGAADGQLDLLLFLLNHRLAAPGFLGVEVIKFWVE